MDKKMEDSTEQGEDKDENFLKKAAHSIRDKLRIKRDKKKPDDKVKSEAANKTDSSSAVSDEDEHQDSRAKSTTLKKEPIGSSSDPSSTSAARDTHNSSGKEPSKADHHDKVRIPFTGVSTVDDSLDRIDEAVKSAKTTVEGGTSNTTFNNLPKSSATRPSDADLGKKPLNKSEGDQHKEESRDHATKREAVDVKDKKTKPDERENETKEEGEGGAIRIDYSETNKSQDHLQTVNRQHGSRKVVPENGPDSSASVTAQQDTNTTPSAPAKEEVVTVATAASDKVDPSAARKSVLKISQDPSSLDTSTKVASLKDDQIHVNIEGIQNMDGLLDCIDDAVQQALHVIETNVSEEQRTAPEAPRFTDNDPVAIIKDAHGESNEHAPIDKSITTAAADEKKSEGAKADWI